MQNSWLAKITLRDEWTESLYFSKLRTEKNLSVTFVPQLELGKKIIMFLKNGKNCFFRPLEGQLEFSSNC